MKDEHTLDEEDETSKEEQLEAGEISSSEEAFMQGYNEDAEGEECAECGSALPEEGTVTRTFESEVRSFCCKSCAEDYEESLES